MDGLLLVVVLAGCGSGPDRSGQADARREDQDTVAVSPWAAPTEVTQPVALTGLDLGSWEWPSTTTLT